MNIWARLGLSVAILAVFAVLATEVFKRSPQLHERKKIIAGVLAGSGTLLWLIGKAHSSSNTEETLNQDRVFSTRFCGSILAACAGIITNISVIQQAVSAPQNMIHVTARERRAESASPTPERKPERRKGRSDSAQMRVQGIIFNRNPSAIINGKTVFVGDSVRGARVVAIARDAVTLQEAEEKIVLALK
jgi:hypothetical protein